MAALRGGSDTWGEPPAATTTATTTTGGGAAAVSLLYCASPTFNQGFQVAEALLEVGIHVHRSKHCCDDATGAWSKAQGQGEEPAAAQPRIALVLLSADSIDGVKRAARDAVPNSFLEELRSTLRAGNASAARMRSIVPVLLTAKPSPDDFSDLLPPDTMSSPGGRSARHTMSQLLHHRNLVRLNTKTGSWLDDLVAVVQGHRRGSHLLEPALDAGSAWPFALPEAEVLDAYLEWVVAEHSRLQLPALQTEGSAEAASGADPGVADGANDQPQAKINIPLSSVHLCLRGDSANSFERLMSKELLESELMSMLEGDGDFDEEKAERLRWKLLANCPVMMTLEERDRREDDASDPNPPVDFGEVLGTQRRVVILGDPGSGKTTACRWLACCLARSFLSGIDPRIKEQRLGPRRLPILMRVSEFADTFAAEEKPSLVQFLGGHTWLGSRPTLSNGWPIPAEMLQALFTKFIQREEALIILDGLDEITDAAKRSHVVRSVDSFVNHFVRLPTFLDKVGEGGPSGANNGPGGPNQAAAAAAEGGDPLSLGLVPESDAGAITSANARQEALLPRSSGGNQIVISSRIAGYHASPLKGNISHYTIEPMSLDVVETFVFEWIKAVRLARPDLEQEQEQLPSLSTERLMGAIRSGGRGLKDLATNPLLLSVLCSIYVGRANTLPSCRVEIYDIAMDNLLNVWRARQLRTSLVHLTSMLGSLAEHIHSTSSTGLISAAEARAFIATKLEEQQGGGAADGVDVHEQAEEFLRIAKEEVGLLAARGERLYGFIHLTFQEFMTAKALIAKPGEAVARIEEHMHDARWREPIVLALGMISWQWSEKQRHDVLQAILDMDDHLSAVVPRGPILFSQTLKDLVCEPSRAQILAAACSLTAAALRAPESQRELLVAHCTSMLDECEPATRIATLLALLKHDAQRGPLAGIDYAQKQTLCARYVHDLEVSDRRIAEALFRSLACDLDVAQDVVRPPQRQWACDRALRRIRSADAKALPIKLLPMKAFLFARCRWAYYVNRSPGMLRLFVALYGAQATGFETGDDIGVLLADSIYRDSPLTPALIKFMKLYRDPCNPEEAASIEAALPALVEGLMHDAVGSDLATQADALLARLLLTWSTADLDGLLQSEERLPAIRRVVNTLRRSSDAIARTLSGPHGPGFSEAMFERNPRLRQDPTCASLWALCHCCTGTVALPQRLSESVDACSFVLTNCLKPSSDGAYYAAVLCDASSHCVFGRQSRPARPTPPPPPPHHAHGAGQPPAQDEGAGPPDILSVLSNTYRHHLKASEAASSVTVDALVAPLNVLGPPATGDGAAAAAAAAGAVPIVEALHVLFAINPELEALRYDVAEQLSGPMRERGLQNLLYVLPLSLSMPTTFLAMVELISEWREATFEVLCLSAVASLLADPDPFVAVMGLYFVMSAAPTTAAVNLRPTLLRLREIADPQQRLHAAFHLIPFVPAETAQTASLTLPLYRADLIALCLSFVPGLPGVAQRLSAALALAPFDASHSLVPQACADLELLAAGEATAGAVAGGAEAAPSPSDADTATAPAAATAPVPTTPATTPTTTTTPTTPTTTPDVVRVLRLTRHTWLGQPKFRAVWARLEQGLDPGMRGLVNDQPSTTMAHLEATGLEFGDVAWPLATLDLMRRDLERLAGMGSVADAWPLLLRAESSPRRNAEALLLGAGAERGLELSLTAASTLDALLRSGEAADRALALQLLPLVWVDRPINALVSHIRAWIALPLFGADEGYATAVSVLALEAQTPSGRVVEILRDALESSDRYRARIGWALQKPSSASVMGREALDTMAEMVMTARTPGEGLNFSWCLEYCAQDDTALSVHWLNLLSDARADEFEAMKALVITATMFQASASVTIEFLRRLLSNPDPARHRPSARWLVLRCLFKHAYKGNKFLRVLMPQVARFALGLPLAAYDAETRRSVFGDLLATADKLIEAGRAAAVRYTVEEQTAIVKILAFTHSKERDALLLQVLDEPHAFHVDVLKEALTNLLAGTTSNSNGLLRRLRPFLSDRDPAVVAAASAGVAQGFLYERAFPVLEQELNGDVHRMYDAYKTALSVQFLYSQSSWACSGVYKLMSTHTAELMPRFVREFQDCMRMLLDEPTNPLERTRRQLTTKEGAMKGAFGPPEARALSMVGDLAAGVVADSPSSFAMAVGDAHAFEKLLEAAFDVPFFPIRVSVLTVLSLMKRVQVVHLPRLMAQALRDVSYVQEAAVGASSRFRGIDASLVTELMPMVQEEEESPLSCLVTCRMLHATTLHTADLAVRAELRRSLVEQLCALILDPRSERHVFPISASASQGVNSSIGTLRAQLYPLLFSLLSFASRERTGAAAGPGGAHGGGGGDEDRPGSARLKKDSHALPCVQFASQRGNARYSLNCRFGSIVAPFTFTLGEPRQQHHPLQFISAWLSDDRGGTIPPDIMSALRKLQDLSIKHGTPFLDLAVHALNNAANDNDQDDEGIDEDD